jgi:glycosyltransferase involved in cell wall biosynthesis
MPSPVVCFFQAYNRPYIRTEALASGLAAHGVRLETCQVNRAGPLRYPLALWKLLRVIRRCDVVVANFRCFEILWLLRLLTRKPIVYDAHISFWQSACEERQWFPADSGIGRMLFWWDRLNCRLADHVLIDTLAHREFFRRTFAVPEEKISSIYISCEEHLFQPRPRVETRPAADQDRCTVAFWCGTGIPLQGLDVLYDAMRILEERGERIVLRLAGASSIIANLEARAADEGLRNIVFLGNLPRSRVIDEIAAADIGLGGHYSTVPKARQVIAGKVYELLAMRKPVVVGDSPATREIFVDGENALLCRMGSARSLADAISRLAADPGLADRLAQAGHEMFRERLRPATLVEPLLAILAELATGGRDRRRQLAPQPGRPALTPPRSPAASR